MSENVPRAEKRRVKFLMTIVSDLNSFKSIDDAVPVIVRSNMFWRLLPSGMRKRWWLFRLFDRRA